MKKIKFTLDTVDEAIKEIKAYKKWVVDKTAELSEKLAMIGLKEAAHRFGAAMYDGENDVSLDVEFEDGKWTITAAGQAVCFIEFGSGVYYNPGEPYPNPRPSGIVPIGEYGQGKGKRRGWVFYDNGDNKVFTRGNPASMPMYYATEEMKREIERVAKEVFE